MFADVEDYFQVSAFERHMGRKGWARLPHRIKAKVHRILALFDPAGRNAAFITRVGHKKAGARRHFEWSG